MIVIFLISSFVPIWNAWYFSDWEGLGVRSSIWKMLASIPGSFEKLGAGRFCDYYFENLILLIMVLLAGFGIGYVIGRRIARLEKALEECPQ